MADVKRALRGIPPKQPGEEPASDRQIGYLRSFGYFTENTILSLGMWQASYLIEQAIEIKEEEDEDEDEVAEYKSAPKAKESGAGCTKLVVLLVAAVLLFFGVTKFLRSFADDDASPAKGSSAANFEQPTSPTKEPATRQEAIAPPVVPVVPVVPEVPPPRMFLDDIDPVTGIVRKLASTPLPVTIETVEEISMRDETGKETPIPPGVALTINKRTPGGTLTLDRAGKVYVGNEDRLLGKVKVKN